MTQELLSEQGFNRLLDEDLHLKAIAAYEQSLETEKRWKELVAEGKARCIKTKEIGGYRYHYELIKH